MRNQAEFSGISSERDLREQKYKEMVQAVDMLFGVSLEGSGDQEKIKKLCEAVESCRLPEDDLHKEDEVKKESLFVDKKQDNFFNMLPVINKMAQVFDNFIKKTAPGYSSFYQSFYSQVYNLSRQARAELFDSLQKVDDKVLNQIDEHNAVDLLGSVRLMLTSDLDVEIESAVKFLEQHRDFFYQLSSGVKNFSDQVQDFLQTKEFERAVINAVQKGSDARGERDAATVEIKHCKELLKTIVFKYGLDFDECLDAWLSLCSYDRAQEKFMPRLAIKSNMDTVFNLEEKREGITRLLYKEFGIKNFGRYPEAILVDQFDEFDSKEKPYGILMSAAHDWNGSFGSKAEDKLMWGKLYSSIKEKYGFRIVEVGSAHEVMRTLAYLNKKYGAANKIAFAIGAGHGNKDSIALGRGGKKLKQKDLAGSGAKRIGDFFQPNVPVVLVSCSTGIEDGIGQELSQVLNAKVIAPGIDVGFTNISAHITDSGINFTVKYRDINAAVKPNTDSSVEGKVYKDGEKIA